jgi:RNA polymerase sigma-70 factor (ECF subfamily)
MGGFLRSEFQAWVEPLLQRAAGYAFSILHNREDAEDAVQEAALRGFERLAGFDPDRPFKGWWFAVVRNCCLDRLRQRGRAATLPLDQAEPATAPASSDEEEQLRAAMERLSPPHREILRLRYYGDCSYREIAAALEIPEGTVMSRLHAARQALAGAYRAQEDREASCMRGEKL